MTHQTYEWVVMITETKAVSILAAYMHLDMDSGEIYFFETPDAPVPCAAFRQYINWWKSYPAKIQEL